MGVETEIKVKKDDLLPASVMKVEGDLLTFRFFQASIDSMELSKNAEIDVLGVGGNEEEGFLWTKAQEPEEIEEGDMIFIALSKDSEPLFWVTEAECEKFYEV